MRIILNYIVESYANDEDSSNPFDIFRFCDDFYASPIYVCYENVQKEFFYGRNAGFYYEPSHRVLCMGNMIISCTSYDYNACNNPLKKFKIPYSILKYAFSDEKRSLKAALTYDKVDVDFVKRTWSLYENKTLANLLIRLPGQKLTLNRTFYIEPKQLTIMKENDNGEFEVPIPSSQIGVKDIQCRLISKTIRRGMVKS